MNCRSCGHLLEEVFDLGMHRLPDFVEPGTKPADPWPLRLVRCTWCSLLQLNETTPRELLYHGRYGFKSGVNEAIRRDLEDVVRYTERSTPAWSHTRRWLDIACNDGTLLSFVPDRITRIGIDPLSQFAGEAASHANVIISDYFRPDYFDEKFDVITSVSMFYDLDDPNEFVAGVRDVLAVNGVWVIQQNYALDMLRQNAIDNVCHEHVTYFSVTSLNPLLERHGLEIVDVRYSPVNGGCFRTLVTHQGSRLVQASVKAAIHDEAPLNRQETLRRWVREVRAELDKTRLAVEDLASRGKETWVYGASTRGGTILQLLGMGPEILPYAVERQEAKVGKVMAATGIPIVSEATMRANPPAALLVSPWFFRDVFLQREAAYLDGGGIMMFPLPRFEGVARKK